MSTILDSLKKSSDQRNDGNKNAIDNFNFSDQKKNKFSGLILALILMALTAALLYWGYSYLKTDETKNKTIAEKIVPTTVPEVATTAKDQNNANGIKENNPRIQKPDSQKVKDKMKSMQVDKKKQSIADLNKANLPKTTKLKQTANKPENKTQDMVKKTTKKTEIKKPQKPSKPSQKKPAAKNNYPYIYQLPFSIRKEIPKLKLNIHVYDDLVENRVAVINGEWYAVGNLIEDTILVKDIVQNGVLLEFSGKVFLIPKL